VESAISDIPEAELALLDAVYQLAENGLPVSGKTVAAEIGKSPAEIATAAQRLERRAAITREWGTWQIENRLLFRYRTTGDIIR